MDGLVMTEDSKIGWRKLVWSEKNWLRGVGTEEESRECDKVAVLPEL
jgi:hypothetical protein